MKREERQAGMEAAWQEDKNKREDGEPTEEPAGCEENRSI